MLVWMANAAVVANKKRKGSLKRYFPVSGCLLWLWPAHALAPRLAMEIAVNLFRQRATDTIGLRQVVDAGGLHAAQSAEAS